MELFWVLNMNIHITNNNDNNNNNKNNNKKTTVPATGLSVPTPTDAADMCV